MWNKRKKLKHSIIEEQGKYHKLRKQAHTELEIMEEYFGARTDDKLTIYLDIKKHLEATQKYTSYTGFRGVFLSMVTTIFVYIFTTGPINQFLGSRIALDNYIVQAISLIIATAIILFIFLIMYIIGTSHFFIDDRKRRNQLYINEYLIKLLDEKIKELEKTQ